MSRRDRDEIAVLRMLMYGLRSCQGSLHYKIQLREVWYRPDLPVDVDGFLSGSSKVGPWISLRQYEKLSATNTLYCVGFEKPLSKSAKSAWSLALLTSQFRNQLPRVMRRYPDGLEKIEPGDLMSLDIPIPPQIRGAVSAYKTGVQLLLTKGVSEAQRFADVWFGNNHPEPRKRKAQKKNRA